MKCVRLTTAIVAVAALAACKGNNNGNAADSSATAMRPDSTAPAAATATPPTTTDTTATNSAATGNTAMTDANLLGKAQAGDSAEVAIAKYMMSNTRNTGVRAYADLLEKDHVKGISQVEATAKKASLTPQAPPNDTTTQEASHVIDRLKGLNGNDRDTAFVNHEIQDHQNDIADTKAAINGAQNPDVKALLQKELPELQKHLDRGQALSKQLASKK